MWHIFQFQSHFCSGKTWPSGEFGTGASHREGCHSGYILALFMFDLYAERIIRKYGLYSKEGGVKLGGRDIDNLTCTYNTILLKESNNDLSLLLMKAEKESTEIELQLNTQKTKVTSTEELHDFIVVN